MKKINLLFTSIIALGAISCSSSGNGQSGGGGSTPPGTSSYNEVPLTISAPIVNT